MKKNSLVFQTIQLLLFITIFTIHENQASINMNGGQDSLQIAQKPSEEAVLVGARLFEGSKRLGNIGPACNSCHNVESNIIVSGGLLAKDLTKVYTRMGDAGLSGIIGAPPFPAMASAYSNNKLTEEEIEDLKAFLQFVDANSSQANVSNDARSRNDEVFLIYGPIGIIIWLILIYFFWFNRKKESVKKAVFDRQIKPIN